MNAALISAVQDLEKERGISAEALFEAIETALVAAYKREFTELRNYDNIYAEVDRETGDMTVYQLKEVVEEVTDPNKEISLAEAQAASAEIELGDLLSFQTNPEKLGRLAAQTAKGVIMQNLADAEKARIQQEFSGRVGQSCLGVIQRRDRKEVVVDIDRAEAILPFKEQIRGERYNFNQRMRFYVLKVSERHGRPVVYVSRSHPGLVKCLFEQEVPEIASGTVEIVSIARDAGQLSRGRMEDEREGSRRENTACHTKIAVRSKDPNVEALGACVGQHGMRVQAVMKELGGERIDVIEYSDDLAEFIRRALLPARVHQVYLDDETQTATVIVPDQQLSLAIGKRGQNAKMAAVLTGYKMDIKSETELREALEQELLADLGEEEQEPEQSHEDWEA